MARKATDKEIKTWNEVIHDIMERDGIDEASANSNFTNLLLSEAEKENVEKWKEAVEAVAKENDITLPEAEESILKFFVEFKAASEAKWDEVLTHIEERDGITHQEAGDNFVALMDHLSYEEALRREQGEA